MDISLAIELCVMLIATGALGGFLSGLLGIGGGVIFVPALYFALDKSGLGGPEAMHIAVGTSLLVVLVTGVISALGHHKLDSNDKPTFMLWAPFIIAGVVAGLVISSHVDGIFLAIVFSVVMFGMGIYMLFSHDMEHEKHRKSSWLTTPVQRFFAAIIGIISALIGIGGGILAVPLMAHAGLTMRRAVGTGAALGVIVSLPGMLGYMLQTTASPVPPMTIGMVNLLAGLIMAPLSMLLAPVGVRAAHRLDRKHLRIIFSVVLFLVAIKMFVTAWN